MSLNKVFLIGNVGKDPNVRYIDKNIQNNTKVATFPLATSERYRDREGIVQERTEWHNIVAWRGLADTIERFVHKGSFLYIEGHLATRRYEDTQANITRYTTEVVADNIQILDKKPASEGGYGAQNEGYGQQSSYQPQQPAPAAQPVAQPAQVAPAPAPQPVEEVENDLPF